MGFALGSVGMGLADFLALSPEEWREVCRCWHDSRDALLRSDWERTRWHAAATVQPHVRGRVSPRRLLPLPWDPAAPQDGARMGREERERRMAAALERMGEWLERKDVTVSKKEDECSLNTQTTG